MEILEELQDGSDRIFYRVKYKNQTYILLKETKKFRFENYLKISKILKPFSPEIYDYNEEKLEILMEDLGDISLFEYIKSTKNYKIYYDVILVLKEIQKINAKLPIFDYEHLKYEIDYFLEYNPEYIKFSEFLYENAKNISKLEYSFMHRDFQSRNIIIKNDKIRLIDFQNAHIGPKIYDLSSILIDPYINLNNEIIKELVKFYNCDIYEFKITSIQRICQVCAAFKKLSKYKNFFNEFIPISIERLEELLKGLLNNKVG